MYSTLLPCSSAGGLGTMVDWRQGDWRLDALLIGDNEGGVKG